LHEALAEASIEPVPITTLIAWQDTVAEVETEAEAPNVTVDPELTVAVALTEP
jgi:hypothetical protein